MTHHEIALSSIISLTGLAVLFFQIYPAYLEDAFRQRLFALRRELFVHGINKNISFTDDAYIVLRMQINSVIRFAHRMSFFHFWLFVKFKPEQDEPPCLIVISEDMSVSERKIIENLNRRFIEEVKSYIVLKSTIFSIFITIVELLKKGLSPTASRKVSTTYDKSKIAILSVYQEDLKERRCMITDNIAA